MDQDKIDAGTIAALMMRMKEYRLPRAMRMLERVNKGEKLLQTDIEFLNRVIQDARNSESLIKRHPEYHGLVVRFMDLYTEIINKGVENENCKIGAQDGQPPPKKLRFVSTAGS